MKGDFHMFSTGHLIWIGMCVLLILSGLFCCFHFRPRLKTVLTVCCCLALVSEFIKLFSTIQIVPVVKETIETINGVPTIVYAETGEYAPYLEAEHYPLELCSLQILFIFAARFMPEGKWRDRLLAFMYVTGSIGALLGIIFASTTVFDEYPTALSYFTLPRNYQYFIYHSMLIVLAIYIGFGGELKIRKEYYLTTILGLTALDVVTFYVNSIFTQPVYSGMDLQGVSYHINYFSSYLNPSGLQYSEKWQWMAYLLARFAIAFILISLTFIPFAIRKLRRRQA